MAFFSTLAGILISMAVSVALSVAMSLIFPPKRASPQNNTTNRPKPEDGKYNLKQNVPSLPIVLGRVKKSGDYVFLEETGGFACHVIVHAGHRINAFVQHYLHDEAVTIGMPGGGPNHVYLPAHFFPAGMSSSMVQISTQLGLDVETANPGFMSLFPTLWTADHRGDGLAAVFMICSTVNQELYQKTFPQQMPDHSSVEEGALCYDPRKGEHDPNDEDTWEFTRNLALIRLWHFTHPVGGKLNLADMYLPDWINAANVCDQIVLNRNSEEEPRYHGGLWFRAENDQVEIGRTIDQAGDFVVYEHKDGLIGVHAGEMVAPDIFIDEEVITAFQYDANRRLATNVLAVRGRWTSPEGIYNTVDAAIYGDPYIGEDTERTKTVDNDSVQYHNHIQRLQKIAYIRANAPKVTLTVHYNVEKGTNNIPYRRFVQINYPLRGLYAAVVEIVGHPTLNLKGPTITFEGIIVPPTLYSFNPLTEEGIPPATGENVEPVGVPVPVNFAIGIDTEILTSGQTVAFAVASWDYFSDALSYELEYQIASALESPQSVISTLGESSVRTANLRDGVEYRFRLRAWSNGVPSDWTEYENDTAIADPDAPGSPDNFSLNKIGTTITSSWNNPNSPNLYKTNLYRGVTNIFADAIVVYTTYGGIDQARSYNDIGLSSGPWYYWVQSENSGGYASAATGPETETV